MDNLLSKIISNHKPFQHAMKSRSNLTSVLHSRRSISPRSEKPEPRRGVARAVLAFVFGIALCSNGASAYAPSWQEMNLSHKQYALMLLKYNQKQFKCLNYIFSKESAWNPSAVNKSVKPYAYGIPQLRSKYIVGKSAYTQVEMGVKYVTHRYKSACNAKKHWLSRKWY